MIPNPCMRVSLFLTFDMLRQLLLNKESQAYYFKICGVEKAERNLLQDRANLQNVLIILLSVKFVTEYNNFVANIILTRKHCQFYFIIT